MNKIQCTNQVIPYSIIEYNKHFMLMIRLEAGGILLANGMNCKNKFYQAICITPACNLYQALFGDTRILFIQSSQVEKLNMSEILFVSCPKNCWAFLTPSDSLERFALSVPISSCKTNYLVFNFFTKIVRLAEIFLFVRESEKWLKCVSLTRNA